MLTMLRKQTTRYIPRANRFFSDWNPGPLWKICEKPRINAAMRKENITEAMLAKSKVNLYCLNQFETNETINTLYKNGHVSFSDYALASEETQNKMLWFFSVIKNAELAISKRYIHLKHISHLVYDNFDLFNSKFCQYLLDSKKITIENYIAENKMRELYGLSRLFTVKNIDSFIEDGSVSIDKLLILDSHQLLDLAELLSGGIEPYKYSHNENWDIRNWIDRQYLSIEQFLKCEPIDRRSYFCFMYNKKVPCDGMTLEYFLTLKPSTREYFGFHQNYIPLEEFDLLSSENQKALRTILFSNMGLYALEKNYITVKKFLNLSKSTHVGLTSIFYNRWNDNRGDGIDGKRLLDRIFSGNNDFYFERFSEISDQSEEESVAYLYHYDQEEDSPSLRR